MTTIVLVTIGIILAAVSALMIVWYGGGAFDEGHIQADAARLLTEGSQIERAVGLYRAHEGRTPDMVNHDDPLEALIQRRYLADRPSGGNGRWFVDYSSGMIRADVGAADDSRALNICRAARRSQGLPNPREVYRCDGSDYPFSHPAGSLPANEPCCTWTGATQADIGGGRGSSPGSGGSGGDSGTGGTPADPSYDPRGSTNMFTCEERVDFLRRSFDKIQEGTKAFYMKYHQISTIDQMVDMGYIPGWALTATSGDYTRPGVETGWGHSPWPGGINANKPYVHVNLTEDMFSCFAGTWGRKYGAQSMPDNYYGNHLSERIYLPLFPTDVSTIVSAFAESQSALSAFSTAKGFMPRSMNSLVEQGYLGGLPTSGYGVTSADFIWIARSQAERTAQGDSRAVGMKLNSEEACRAYNLKTYGTDETPDWPSRDKGCFMWNGAPWAYMYAPGAVDPSVWYPYDEISVGNPSPHFLYTSSRPGSMVRADEGRIRVDGYTYWALYRQDNRLMLHPGTESGDAAILRFIAPNAGRFHLRGAWQPIGGCGNGVNVAITGLGVRPSDSRTPWPFDFVRTLAKGQSVDFTLTNRGSDLCDGTYLDLVVSQD